MADFQKLREQYGTFLYRSYTIEKKDDRYRIVFDFSIPGLCDFAPEWLFPAEREVDEDILARMVFPLGLVEAISYYKCVCPRRVIVQCGNLTNEQISWWRKLFYNGLGEFMYRNGIEVSPEELLTITCEPGRSCKEKDFEPLPDTLPSEGCLVPVGGGKDSVVSLELLKNEKITTYTVNRNETEQNVINLCKTKTGDYVAVRNLDPKLLFLNSEGYLNGHTPFSAIVAFSSYIAAYLTGRRYITLSNETSANETTVANSFVNHQYSKSFEFEKDFMQYMRGIVSSKIEYFSLLRPLSELQIAGLFAGYQNYHQAFRSCNVGSKKGIWCCNCPKCLFVYIILSPFLSKEERVKIFSESLLDKESLDEDFRRLTGLLPDKPFECVGTRREVLACLNAMLDRGEQSLLLSRYQKEIGKTGFQVTEMLTEWVSENNVPMQFQDLVKRGVKQWTSLRS